MHPHVNTFDDILIDASIWHVIEQGENARARLWHDQNGVTLALEHIGIDHELRARFDDEGKVREHYRNCFAEAGMGILQCHLAQVAGQQCVKVIAKKIEPGKPASYVGSLAFPLATESFVVTLHARERGITGVRDATILALMMSKNPAFGQPGERGLQGWNQDPYFPDYTGPSLRNLSDSEDYDAQFPDHPLTRVRNRLNELTRDLRFSDAMLEALRA